MIAPIEFEFRYSQPRRESRRRSDDDVPMRILIMADLSGRRNRAGEHAGAMAPGRLARIDIDSFDKVLRTLAPSLGLPIAPNASPIQIGFGSLDDFHPDSLLARLGPVVATTPSPVQATAPVPVTSAQTAKDDAADTVERLLGRRPAVQAPEAGVDAFIRSIVAPHITPAPQTPAPGDIDHSAETAMLRAVLHHPDFQRLEAAWRGVHWLVSRLALDDGRLEVHVLDISRSDIEHDLTGAGESLEDSALFQLLVTDDPWSLVVSDLSFGPGTSDITLLAALGAIAAHAGGPFLAAADPTLVGLHSFHDAPDPRNWPGLSSVGADLWNALRRSPIAPWIGLAAPRLLLRQPYGQRSDPIEHFDFDELGEAREHDHYLWGSGALGVAWLIAESFSEDGWDMTPGSRLDIDDLPVHSYHEAQESRMQACAEALLGERGYEALLGAGLIPLMSARHRGAVRILRFQSIAQPASALAGPWDT